MHLIDETGNVYGRLTVLERYYPDENFFASGTWAYWLCECECGKTTIVSGANLRRGNTQSCGCLRSERSSEAAKAKWAEYRRRHDKNL